MEISSGVSGGTIATALNVIETFSFKDLKDTYKPFGISPITPPNFVKQSDVLHDDRLGGWIGPWIMSNTNAAVVSRTYGLLGGQWGDKFTYGEYYNWGSWLKCYGTMALTRIVSVGLILPPVRWLVKMFVPVSGDGPSEGTMRNGSVTMKIVAETDEEVPRSASVTVTGDGDPAYLLTCMIYLSLADLAMMLVEAAMTLAYDVEKTEVWKRFFENGENKVVLATPALLGEVFRDRLDKGGLHFTLDL